MDNEEIHIEYMKVSEMAKRYLKDNFQIHDIQLIQKAIAQYGFRNPVIYDEMAEAIVSGNGRIEALLAMETLEYDFPILEPKMERYGAKWKWLVPENIKIDEDGEWLVPVIRGTKSESYAEAVSYAIVDNTAKKGNTLSKAGTLNVIGMLDFDFGDDLPITFTKNEIDFLSSLNNHDLSEMDEYGAKDDEQKPVIPDKITLILGEEEDIESVNEMLLEFIEEMGLSIKVKQTRGRKEESEDALPDA